MRFLLFFVFTIFTAPLTSAAMVPTHKKAVILRSENNFWATFKIIHQQTITFFSSKHTFQLSPSEQEKLKALFQNIQTPKEVEKLHHPVTDTLLALTQQQNAGNIKLNFDDPQQRPVYIRFTKQPLKEDQKRFLGPTHLLIFEVFSTYRRPPQYIVNILESICAREAPPYIFPTLLSSLAFTSASLFTFFCRSKKTQITFDYAYHKPQEHCAQIASEIGKRIAFYKNISSENCFFADLVKIVSPVPDLASLAWVEPRPIQQIPPETQLACFNAPFVESVHELCALDFSAYTQLQEIILIAPSAGVNDAYLKAIYDLQTASGKAIQFFALETSGENKAISHHQKLVEKLTQQPHLFWVSALTQRHLKSDGTRQICHYINSPQIACLTPDGKNIPHNEDFLLEQFELAEILAQESSLQSPIPETLKSACEELYAELQIPKTKNVLVYDETSKTSWFSKSPVAQISFALIFSPDQDRWESQEYDTHIQINGQEIPITTDFDYTVVTTTNPFKNDDSFLFETPQTLIKKTLREVECQVNPSARETVSLESFSNIAESWGPIIAAQLKIARQDALIKTMVKPKPIPPAARTRAQPATALSHAEPVVARRSTFKQLMLGNDKKPLFTDTKVALPLEPEIEYPIPENCKFICVQAPHANTINWLFAQPVPATLQHYVLIVDTPQITASFIRKCRKFCQKITAIAPTAKFKLVLFEQSLEKTTNQDAWASRRINQARKNKQTKEIARLLDHILTNQDGERTTHEWIWIKNALKKNHIPSVIAHCSWQQKSIYAGMELIFMEEYSRSFFAPEFNQELIKKTIATKFPELLEPRPALWRNKGLVRLNILICDFETQTLYVQDPNRKVSHALVYGKTDIKCLSGWQKTYRAFHFVYDVLKAFVGSLIYISTDSVIDISTEEQEDDALHGIVTSGHTTHRACRYISQKNFHPLTLTDCGPYPQGRPSLTVFEDDLQIILNDVNCIKRAISGENNHPFRSRSRTKHPTENIPAIVWKCLPKTSLFDFFQRDTSVCPQEITPTNKHWFAVNHEVISVDDFIAQLRKLMEADAQAFENPANTEFKSSSNNKLILVEVSEQSVCVLEEALAKMHRIDPQLAYYLFSTFLSKIVVLKDDKTLDSLENLDLCKRFTYTSTRDFMLYEHDAKMPDQEKMPILQTKNDRVYIKPLIKHKNYAEASEPLKRLQRTIHYFDEIHYFKIPSAQPQPPLRPIAEASPARRRVTCVPASATPVHLPHHAVTNAKPQMRKATLLIQSTARCISNDKAIAKLKSTLEQKKTINPDLKLAVILILQSTNFVLLNNLLTSIQAQIPDFVSAECYITGKLSGIVRADIQDEEEPVHLTEDITHELVNQHAIRSTFFDNHKNWYTHTNQLGQITFDLSKWTEEKPNLAARVAEWGDESQTHICIIDAK